MATRPREGGLKVLLATYGMRQGNRHLMPWRTLCEVASGMSALGHDATLVSIDNLRRLPQNDLDAGYLRLGNSLRELRMGLQAVLEEKKPDVIYWPLTWRERRQRLRLLRRTSAPLIGYFPGGYYKLGQALYATSRIGLRAGLPYLVEALGAAHRDLGFLRGEGFERLISMTDTTARMIVASGWPVERVHVIPPGKDDEGRTETFRSLPPEVTGWLAGRPFYLFMGPPSAIRGVYELLKAFDIAADTCRNLCLICLFRSDGTLDSRRIRSVIDTMKHRTRVWSEWRSIDRQLLPAFLSHADALVLPFLLVPSEIPLAIIEAMQWGKPIITTNCGGTGEFVKPFGFSTPAGDLRALVLAMTTLADSPDLAAEKGLAARDLFARHPTWPAVAHAWCDVANCGA